MAKSNFATLGDFVWLDLDENGIQDSGEPGIANVTVSLVDSVSGQVRSGAEVTSDANGYFQLDNVRWENAYLRFTLPDDFSSSLLSQAPSHFPASSAYYEFTEQAQGGNRATDSNVDALGRGERIDLAEDSDTDLNYDAGVKIKPTQIGDYVWLDSNGNGQQDSGESGVGGATVKLMQGNTEISRTTSAADGSYQLVAPQGGEYYLQFALPTGDHYVFSRFTEQNAVGVDDSIDSDANRDTGKTHSFTLISGETVDDVDAGLYERDQLVSLGDKVWHDSNYNGIQDAGESGVANAEVRLLNGDGAMERRTFTDAEGEYRFDELLPGDYQVRFIAPRDQGYMFSDKQQGSDSEKDSNADSNGYTDTISLVPGVSNLSVDAGLVKGVGIGDFVWHDVDADGRQDAGEAGVAGVTVKLMQGATAVTTTTTDDNGYYYLSHDQAGSYSVKFELPSEYVFSRFTEQDAPGVDDTKDSDANRDTGETHSVSLALGERVDHIDAGVYERAQLATLGDYVWYDADKDGIQDSSEAGIEGVEVRLLDDAGDLLQRTETDTNGKYSFNELLPGDYQVRVIAPAGSGYFFSPNGQGGDGALDSNVDAAGYSEKFTLTAGESNLDVDAGMHYDTMLGDYVWLDSDGDGVQDKTESGINGLSVELYKAGESTPFMTTVTQDNPADGQAGHYAFEDLPHGDYRVKFDVPDATHGFTVKDKTNDSKDSDVNSDGYTDVFTLDGDNLKIDAGIYEGGSIGNYVWNDVVQDGDVFLNGLQDDNESGLAGVTVTLYVKDQWGKYVPTDDAPQTTQADGAYYFGGLEPGDYAVKFAKGGYLLTYQNQGNDDSKDSDADRNTGLAYVSINANEHIDTIDAGMSQTARIGDYTWYDWTPQWGTNGIQDGSPYDHAMAAPVWLIKQPNPTQLTYATNLGGYEYSTQSNGAGEYHFDVLPGRYTIATWDWSITHGGGNAPGNQGSDDTKDSDISLSGWWCYGGCEVLAMSSQVITVSAGDVQDQWDVGLTPLVIDLNQNGIQTLAYDSSEARFDLLGNGQTIHSGWLSSEDGFLAIDNNGNGNIDNLNELFGGFNQGDGFAKLADFDSNGDGVVDANDVRFSELTIWQDANNNKLTDDGELRSLSDAGVVSLKVDYVELPELDENGNLHLERSSATLADGSEVDMTDVYFAVAAEDAAAASVDLPSMAELLAGEGSLDGLLGGENTETVIAETMEAIPTGLADQAQLVNALYELV